MKCSLGISDFLEEISRLSHSTVCSISLYCSHKAVLSLLAILWNSAFSRVYLSFSLLPFISLLFSAICKPSSDNHFAFLDFFFLGMVLVTAPCTTWQPSIHSSSSTLSSRSNPLNLFTGIVFWVQYVADARASSHWALKDLLLKARPLYTSAKSNPGDRSFEWSRKG